MRGQLSPQLGLRTRSKKRIGQAKQQATAIAGFAIGRDAAAMGHTSQRLDGGREQALAGLTLQVCNQAEAAVVPKFFGAVQTETHRLYPDMKNIFKLQMLMYQKPSY